MTDHDKLYEIVQKVFNAGRQYELDNSIAMIKGKDLPTAYPVITPLLEELIAYVDEQIALAKQPTLGIRPVEIRDGQIHET